MGSATVRCPHCEHGYADLWRVTRKNDAQVEHFVCGECTLQWEIAGARDAVSDRQDRDMLMDRLKLLEQRLGDMARELAMMKRKRRPRNSGGRRHAPAVKALVRNS